MKRYRHLTKEIKKGPIQEAQGMVEFALILPVILITLFVLVELARVLHAWLSVENGARAGVRYAVTAEFNPANCPVAGCLDEDDEKKARVASIHDAAWAGSSSIVRVGIGEAQPNEASYFNVIVCDPQKLVKPASTFDTFKCVNNSGDFDEIPGDPGDLVVVVVEFNHPVLTPLLSTVWPSLRLSAERQAQVETYRVPLPVGTAPAYDSPTPKFTNTPNPTKTQGIPMPPPSCDKLWISDIQGDIAGGSIKVWLKGYSLDDLDPMHPNPNYQVTIYKFVMSQDYDISPSRIDSFVWTTYDTVGGSSTRADNYGGPAEHDTEYYPNPSFPMGICYPSANCPSFYYRGELTTYFRNKPLIGEYSVFVTFAFPDYNIICKPKWKPFTAPGVDTDTPVPYHSNTPGGPDIEDTPTATWIAPIPSDTPDTGLPDD